MLRKIMITVALIFTSVLQAAGIVEGKQYTLIEPPVLVTEANDKIQVIEFFSYGCPHCASLEPYVKKWSAQKPNNVVLKAVPVEFMQGWDKLAKLYYTTETLNAVDKMDPIIFSTVQSRKLDLTDEEVAADLFAQNGIDKQTFKNAYNSFSVDTALNTGRLLAQQYKVTGVPLFIVDGRYKTSVGMAGGPQGLSDTLNFLIAKVEEKRKASK